MNYLSKTEAEPLTPLGVEGPVVVAQLGQSLDGRIATATGASKYISGFEALKHLHRLRAEVDAVLIGVGTLIADDPALTVRHLEGKNPVRVVIDPNGRAPHDARIMTDGAADVVVLTKPGANVPPGVRQLEIEPEADGCFPPAAIIAALAKIGLTRVLVEGGEDKINVRVPLALIRTGIQLTTLMPLAASEQLTEHGIDLSQFKNLDQEELMDALRDLSVDITSDDGDRIRVFCE